VSVRIAWVASVLATCGCAGSPPYPASHRASHPAQNARSRPPAIRLSASADSSPAEASAFEHACLDDRDCGFDPAVDGCRDDPRANRQPPLRDQGIICWCDERVGRCATLRVPPVPCESEESCAIGWNPRPHPIRSARGRAPIDADSGNLLRVTCERTNLCTLIPTPRKGHETTNTL
jgi:hypothetical protein